MATTWRKSKLPRGSHDRETAEKKLKNNENEEKKCVNTDVELTFDVLTIILKNLNAKDLCAAAMVCRSWNDAAESEKKARGNPVTFLRDLEDSWMDTDQMINQLRIKPLLGLMFSRPFDKDHPAAFPNNDECPCRLLPDQCQSILVGNYGVVKDRSEFEGNPDKASWMWLPHNEDVAIEVMGVPSTASQEQFEQGAINVVKKLTTAKNKAKCFILLTTEDSMAAFRILPNVPRNKKQVVSGVVTCNLALCKRDKDGTMCGRWMSWVGILISGPSVRSWSVVLSRNCDTSDKIAAKLQLLKSRVQLQKHSMGFMFACEGRGEYMFGEKNVESSAFKALFPNVPLVGTFGGGEYGDSSIASHRTNASIFHRIYDHYLRLIVNLGVTYIWRLFGVSKHEAMF